MSSKILSKRTELVVGLIGGALVAVFFFNFIPKNSIWSSSPFVGNTIAGAKQDQTVPGLPIRLKIPNINVDTAVEYVGLTPDGAMDVPKNQNNVAWYEPGQRPGEKGSAVIAGHFGLKNGKLSVFDNLHKLHQGDKLYVVDDKGVIISFVVRESRSFNPQADASGVFGSNDGKVHLNLITCEGVWDKVAKSYPKRLVVFTDKE